MARAARKAKAKPAGKRAPASGKQRKYSRDNMGRFASTGTGATARGGRLLTATGNKRKTQTITAAARKGVIGKPKGLKPGAITTAAKRREANSVRKGNRVLTTDADRRSRQQSLATAERALAAIKASPGKGRDRLLGGDSKLKLAQARVDGLKGPLPSSRKVNRSAQAAANRDALAIRRSEQRNAKTMADFTAAKSAAAKPAAAKKRVRSDGAAFAERNKRTNKIELTRSIKETDRDNALTSEQRRKTPVAKRLAQMEEKTARAKRTAARAKEFYRNYGSDSTFGRRPRLSTAGGAKFGAKVKAKKPAAAKPATKKPKTELQTLQQADRLMGKLAKRQASIKADKVGLDEGLRQVRRNNGRAASVTRALENRGLLGKYQKLTAPADAIRMTPAGKGIPQPKAAKKPAAVKPAVSARGRTAPKPAPRTTPSSADGKLSFRTRGKAAAAQRKRISATQEKTSSQVIGAQRGVKRTAASGNRAEKIAVTKVASKQGNLLTGKTETTKHVKVRIVARNGGPSIGSKAARRSRGVMTRKMETPRSNRGRKQNRLRGLAAAREKKTPYDKKKAAKTLATKGKAAAYYGSLNKLY